VLPRIVWLAVMRATGWNESAILAGNVVAALGTLALMAWLVVRTVGPVAPALVPWLVLVCSWLTFSLGQWENWTWGLQLSMFLGALCTAAGVATLARWNGSWRVLAGAGLAAVASTLSFGSGLLLLAVLPAAVLVWPGLRGRVRRAPRAAALALAGAVFAGLYLSGWQYPPRHPSPATSLRDPGVYVEYVLAFVGAGWSLQDAAAAAAWGGVGIGLFLGGTIWLWRARPGWRRTLMPWLVLAAYAALTATVTGIGRAGFGVAQALSPRYVTVATFFWESLAVVLALAATAVLARWDTVGGRVGVGVVTAVVVAGAGASYLRTWQHGTRELALRYDALRLAAECVVHFDSAPEECLRRLHPDPPALRLWAADARRLGVGPFAAIDERAPLAGYASVVGAAGYVDAVGVLGTPPTEEIRVAGWAIDPVARRPAQGVLLLVDGRLMGRATPGLRRPDVGRFHGRAVRDSGWELRFGRFRLPPGPHRLEAYAVLAGRRVVRLQRTRQIDADPAWSAGGDRAPPSS